MRTEHLAYFIDIAASGSLSKTAERFFTSHQVVKKAVKSLEDEWQVKLLETSNQGSTLTEAGKIFLRFAQDFLALNGDLKQALKPFVRQSAPGEAPRTITFCMTPYLTDSLILDFIDTYQKHKPEVRLKLLSLPVQHMFEQIASPSTIFLIPTIEEAVRDEGFQRDLAAGGLTYFVLAERPLYICTYEKSKWARQAFYTEAELAAVPQLVSSSATINTHFMRGANQQLVNSIEAQKNLIKKGAGITLVTSREFDYYFKGEGRYVLIPTDLTPVWYICIHQKDEALPDYVSDFLKQLEGVL